MRYGWFIGGVVIGAVVAMITLLSTGWMVTSGLAETMKETAVHNAMKNKLASICVAQFERSANQDAVIDKLKSRQEWERGNFVAERGWATMPGSESSESFVANECAERIVEQTG